DAWGLPSFPHSRGAIDAVNVAGGATGWNALEPLARGTPAFCPGVAFAGCAHATGGGPARARAGRRSATPIRGTHARNSGASDGGGGTLRQGWSNCFCQSKAL